MTEFMWNMTSQFILEWGTLKVVHWVMVVLTHYMRVFNYVELNIFLFWLNTIRNHKEVKSARDPIVGPPDRPGSRVHCPAPVLTRPLNTIILTLKGKCFISTIQGTLVSYLKLDPFLTLSVRNGRKMKG